jgi:hypothetical protein
MVVPSLLGQVINLPALQQPSEPVFRLAAKGSWKAPAGVTCGAPVGTTYSGDSQVDVNNASSSREQAEGWRKLASTAAATMQSRANNIDRPVGGRQAAAEQAPQMQSNLWNWNEIR